MRELAAAWDWLTVFHSPPYASELTALVKSRLRRMQYRPGLLNSFLARTRLDLTSLL